MYKLKKNGDIVSPAKNLYVIVPPEHQIVGCIPPKRRAYTYSDEALAFALLCVFALSAALYHGASHQKPQVFQVMTDKQIKALVCGKLKIDFVYKKSLTDLLTQKMMVKTGYLTVSTPELTAFDLMHYPHHVGGLNHIATVLSELIETINPDVLIALVTNSVEKAWAQRFGYLLEHIDSMDVDKQQDIATRLHEALVKPLSPVPLSPELPIKGEARDHRWMIIENTTIESDL